MFPDTRLNLFINFTNVLSFLTRDLKKSLSYCYLDVQITISICWTHEDLSFSFPWMENLQKCLRPFQQFDFMFCPWEKLRWNMQFSNLDTCWKQRRLKELQTFHGENKDKKTCFRFFPCNTKYKSSTIFVKLSKWIWSFISITMIYSLRFPRVQIQPPKTKLIET